MGLLHVPAKLGSIFLVPLDAPSAAVEDRLLSRSGASIGKFSRSKKWDDRGKELV